MFPRGGTYLPEFAVGDWVEITDRCLVTEYQGKIVQIVEIEDPYSAYGRAEYTCQMSEDKEQAFWEHELILSKIIPINGILLDGKPVAEESEEEDKPKVIWV